ncbi:MAG TPA: GGDEF domain-containing protein [Burkholderiales bacterium]
MSELLSGSNALFSRDESQALRMRRYLMAAGTSLLLCLTLLFFAFVERLPWRVAIEGTAGVLGLILLFFALFRSGLNLRFSDPSLTTEQLGAALLLLAYLMAHAGAARSSLVLFYPVAMLFGVLRLNSRRLMALAFLALAAHGTMLALLMAREPLLDRGALLAEFAVLIVVLPWFAAMGGYVNRLRTRLSDSNRDLKRAFDRIEQLAVRDALTGSYNRRFLMDCLAGERSRAERLGTAFAVCLVDLDHFKAINDDFGHAAGDAVLMELPVFAAAGLRAIDVFGRFGGEEFLLVLPGATLEGARAAAERVRRSIEAARFPALGERPVTVTIGVAEHGKGEDVAALLARADRALYAGKARGRNCVVIG